VPSPGVPKPEVGYNLRKAVRKICTPISIEIARPCIHNGNPIVLGRSVNGEPEFCRPPIRLTLIDEGDQFRGCSLGSIDDLHGVGTQCFLAPNFFIRRIITGRPHRRQTAPAAESAARDIGPIFEISVWG
jgi:hypothetical protein